MSKKKNLLFSLIATLAGASASAASAADLPVQSETYVGANIGSGAKVYGGVLHQSWGLEAVAFGTGEAEGTYKLAGKDAKGKLKMSGVGLVGVLPLRLGDFTLKGKLGLAYARGEVTYKNGSNYKNGISDKASGVAPLVGVGVAYAFNKNISLVADLDLLSGKYNKAGDRAGVGMLSVGASYRF